MTSPPAEHPFAAYVRTLGRGPGRSRSLTREEARIALRMVLQGEADDVQVGAFLMLLRYRGEDPAEIAGLVEAARDTLPPTAGLPRADLDWPSYGAGRTRGEPWFLLAALALAASGVSVLMHGSNEFSQATPVEAALAELGLPACRTLAEAGDELARRRFAYMPLAALSPKLDGLLTLRARLGLRSPINTVVRLLNPLDAPASVSGVFHPAYIEVHLAAAALLGRQRLAVVKGGGGEAERNPAKPVAAHLFAGGSRSELLLPAIPTPDMPTTFAQTWQDGVGPGAAIATATITLALLAIGAETTVDAAETSAASIWAGRNGLETIHAMSMTGQR